MGFADGFLRRFDSAGATLWTRQFGTASTEVVRNVAVGDDGHAYVAGYTAGAFVGQRNAGSEDVFVRQYDAAGSAQWTIEFGSTNSDTVSGIAADGAMEVYDPGQPNDPAPESGLAQAGTRVSASRQSSANGTTGVKSRWCW